MDSIIRLIHEIHRRSVWQVLGVYLVGSWLGYQVILSLTDGLGLPAWVPPFAVVLFIIGLPIVLATAIVQEPAARRGAETPPVDAEHLPAAAETRPETADASRHAAAARRAPMSAVLTWRRTLTAGVLAFVVLGAAAALFLGMRTMGIGPAGTLLARGMLDAHGRIVLADFHNSTPDADLGNVVTSALRIDLVQSPTVSVADTEFVRDVLSRMGRDPSTALTPDIAREVALREGIGAVLAGEIGVAGAGYLLTATLVATEGGATLAAFRETARDAASLIDAIDRLSRQVRERIGEPLRSVRQTEPLARVTTGSLDALRLYARALRMASHDGDYVGAVRLLDEVVALDDEFAAAYMSTAIYLGIIGVERARRIEASTRAYELRHRLTPTERGRATAYYYTSVVPDRGRAIQAMESMVEANPSDVSALNNLAVALRDDGQYQRAEQFLRRAAEAGEWPGYYYNLVRVLAEQDRHEEAAATASEAWRLFEDHPFAHGSRFVAAAAAADWNRALGYATAMYAAAGSNMSMRARALSHRSSVLYVLGRWSEADRDISEITSMAEALGLSATDLSLRVLRATFRVEPWVRPDAAIATVQADLARLPLDAAAELDRPYAGLARFYISAGRLADGEHYLDRYTVAETKRGAEPPRLSLQLRGALALRQGRLEDAFEQFARIERDRGGCRICHLPDLGLAYEAAGRPDSAVATYERYLATPWAHRDEVDAMHRARVLVRLADLHADMGNRNAAATRLAEFIELWRDADADLQPHVANARRRIEGLMSEAANPGA